MIVTVTNFKFLESRGKFTDKGPCMSAEQCLVSLRNDRLGNGNFTVADFKFWRICPVKISVGIQARKKNPNLNFLSPDIFWWGGGLPREGVGAKKFGMSLETQGIKLFWRDIPGFCRDIPEAPEKFKKKCLGFFRVVKTVLLANGHFAGVTPAIFVIFVDFRGPRSKIPCFCGQNAFRIFAKYSSKPPVFGRGQNGRFPKRPFRQP